ncbi:MAG TPA: class I SAM-dependent methyltransferase [Magnetospirillaceae bacterium]|nr:class I SAM-dependent methyltransferase [Magnetospirillaceae bacterium]
MTKPDFHYEGDELSLFAGAVHWRAYWTGLVSPLLGERVLEVGAGLGSATKALCGERQTDWVCLEPDPTMAAHLERETLPSCCRVAVGDMSALEGDERFDTVLYIDVLEHIADDRAELERAAARLRPGGRLIVLAPAHQWLYSPFDKAVGHHRRYTLAALQRLTPPGVTVESARYLDSVGLLASAANRFLLKASMPTPAQIRLWDDRMVPVSRHIDRLLGHALGKTALMVWKA